MKPYPTHKQRTQRAFRAYTDLIDTAEWLKNRLRGPLWSFDLTMGEFRLLELLYREKELLISDVLRKRKVRRQNMMVVIRRLIDRGYIRRFQVTLPPVEKSRVGRGRQASAIGLTKSGTKFIGVVLPNHSKLVKALMRAIDGRQQETLSQICRRLRAGDALKFVKEIMMEDEEWGEG
ncbi:MAG TPA: MarR family transcriptional regulator [Candidatus Aquilonibacter sp.]|nr:MarR family transcriptional regulator [Candidatus Aquilonibacter sp.]